MLSLVNKGLVEGNLKIKKSNKPFKVSNRYKKKEEANLYQFILFFLFNLLVQGTEMVVVAMQK